MKFTARAFQNWLLIALIIAVLAIDIGRCQDEEEDEEDTYDEELGDSESTTTSRSRRSSTTTKSEAPTGQSDRSSTLRSVTEATTRNPDATPASAPAPTRAAPTTTESEYEDDEETTTTERGYGYIFRPLNNLVDNIVAGNVTGIVDNALSIRTPPEIRAFVNNVMSNVFGAGIGTALKQFMPNLFSTSAPPTVNSPGRDPIPVQSVIQQPIPITAVLTARTNGTEDDKVAKKQQPLQLTFAHPGAPASRLRCEVIM